MRLKLKIITSLLVFIFSSSLFANPVLKSLVPSRVLGSNLGRKIMGEIVTFSESGLILATDRSLSASLNEPIVAALSESVGIAKLITALGLNNAFSTADKDITGAVADLADLSETMATVLNMETPEGLPTLQSFAELNRAFESSLLSSIKCTKKTSPTKSHFVYIINLESIWAFQRNLALAGPKCTELEGYNLAEAFYLLSELAGNATANSDLLIKAANERIAVMIAKTTIPEAALRAELTSLERFFANRIEFESASYREGLFNLIRYYARKPGNELLLNRVSLQRASYNGANMFSRIGANSPFTTEELIAIDDNTTFMDFASTLVKQDSPTVVKITHPENLNIVVPEY